MVKHIGPTVVVARDAIGNAIALGPFDTDAEIDDLREMITANDGWTIELTCALISMPQIQGIQEQRQAATGG